MLKQALVLAGEPRFFHAAVIPENDDPSIRFKDARKFAAGGLRVEPVKSLSCGDEVDRRVAKRGGFGGAFDTREAVVGGEIFLAGPAHVCVGFDTGDAVAVFKEKLAEDAGTGADVGDDVAGLEAAFRAQEIENGCGIAGAIADVVCHAIGEALVGVREWHSAYNQSLRG